MIHILGRRRRRRRRDNHWESSTCAKRRQAKHSAIVAQHQKLFGAAIDNCDETTQCDSQAAMLSDSSSASSPLSDPQLAHLSWPEEEHCVRHCTPRTCLGNGLITLPLPSGAGSASSSSSSSSMALTCLSANQTQPPSRRTANSDQQLFISNCQSREIPERSVCLSGCA